MTWDEVIEKLTKAEVDVVRDFGDPEEIEGMFWHRGSLMRADGKVLEAWILKSWLDSGEQFGAIFKWGEEWVAQASVDWKKSNPKIKAKFFPYKYRLRVQCPGDIHQSEMY
jgi:hypothetical protein